MTLIAGPAALKAAIRAPIRYIRMQDKTGNMGTVCAFEFKICKYAEAQAGFSEKATCHQEPCIVKQFQLKIKQYRANAWKLLAFAWSKVPLA